MSLAMRLRAYAPNGAPLGILPAPSSVQAAMPFGDVGGVEVAYPKSAPKASALAGPCEIALEVTYDEGVSWTEPNDARFLRLVRKGDTVDSPELRTYSGPAYLWRLCKARVLPEGLLNAEGKRPFLSKNAGAIMRTLTNEAQARGALAGMDFTTFSEDFDSNGTPWPSVITLYYEPGMDYLTVLLNLHAQGLVDFTMAGRSLRLYAGDTVMAGASGATLQKGRDLTEAPYTGTLEGLANFVYLAGDSGLSFSRTNVAADAPWGRWESYISQGGVTDTGTMTVLTDSALELSGTERVENTYGLEFAAAKHLPFRDYGLGKDVKVRDGEGVPVSLRCRQITLTRDERGHVGGNVVLNDRFLENEVRQVRRVQGITGGSTADGGSGARPAPDGPDRIAPAAPVIGSLSSDSYLDDEGKVWATVVVNINAPTLNADGTALTDLAGYEVYWRLASDVTWTLGTISEDTSVSIGGYYPNTVYEFMVRALDDSGNRSAESAAGGITTDDDVTVPSPPSQPIVTSYLGQLLVKWDGLVDTNGDGIGNAPPPTDFAAVEMHVGTATGFVPSAATLLDTVTDPAGGSSVATGLIYEGIYAVKLVMVDRSGNRSAESFYALGQPHKAAAGDIESITANQITAGAISAAITVSGRIATALTGARVELNSTGMKAYNAAGQLTVDVPSSGTGATFVGTLRTGFTGARAEIVPNGAGATINLYSGMASETEPGSIYTYLRGSGAAADASTVVSSPSKNGLPASYLELRSRDADSGADMLVDTKNGSVFWLSDPTNGTHYFANNAAGAVVDWLQIYRSTDYPNPGSASLYARNNLLLQCGPARAVKIIGILDHSGGQLKLSDEFGSWRWISGNDGSSYLKSEVVFNRTATFTANVGIASSPSGVFYRITSSRRFKVEIEPQEIPLDSLRALVPRSYVDRGDWERADESAEGLKRHLGLIAEEVAEIPLLGDLLVPRDEDGQPGSVDYDRLAVALLPWLRSLEDRLDALETPHRPVR